MTLWPSTLTILKAPFLRMLKCMPGQLLMKGVTVLDGMDVFEESISFSEIMFESFELKSLILCLTVFASLSILW